MATLMNGDPTNGKKPRGRPSKPRPQPKPEGDKPDIK